MIDGGLTFDDPRSTLVLAELGARPGDLIELDGHSHSLIRLAGDARDLYRPVRAADARVSREELAS